MRAFEANAVDYLVARLGASASSDWLVADRIPVREGEQVVFVAVEDSVWIKASRNTVPIHLADRCTNCERR